jgi:ergothioneine biosynthesis protein EgtB
MSRPAVDEVYAYRKYVDKLMIRFLIENELSPEQSALVTLGLHHEQQHQELLLTDIKYILGHNPLFPHYGNAKEGEPEQDEGFCTVDAGLYTIGYTGEGFCFDNELSPHQVYLNDFSISKKLVTCGEYLDFIRHDGYNNFRYWHSEGWDWVKQNKITAPLYWHLIGDDWHQFTLAGLEKINPDLPLAHVSFYEASAYAAWKGMRLPTEYEWEAASSLFKWGQRWEWTSSAYLPYPGFRKAEGAIGEYNGKFMVNQMVLRGASVATPARHSRPTYRNFFHPHAQWQYSGIRLAQN